MSKDLKDFKPQLIKTGAWLKRYSPMLLFIMVAGMYAFLILQINILSHQEPSDAAVRERIQTVKKPSIDANTADKLKALEDNSQEVKALFEEARDNPFQE